MSELAEFHDVRFPTAISFGATGGPRRRNEIVALTSGHEVRNARQAHARRVFDAGTGVRSIDDLTEIVAFFEACRGSLHGFRFRDPFDMKSSTPAAPPASSDQLLGEGDGIATDFALRKSYGAGSDAYFRPITRPVAGTVRVAVGGVEQAVQDFTIDHATGIVSLSDPPAAGVPVSAGFEFDIPARFDAEALEISLTAFHAGQIPSIPIIEIRE